MFNLGAGLAAGIALPSGVQAAAQGPQLGDVFVRTDTEDKTPFRAEAILLNAAPIVAWPMERATGQVRNGSRYNQVLLLRVEAPTTTTAATAPLPGERVLAFSAICTHAACLVSDWVVATHHLRCPCHGSEYDPARDAAVTGGPAQDSLPMLPVDVRDGLVVAAGGFSKPPGGHASRTM